MLFILWRYDGLQRLNPASYPSFTKQLDLAYCPLHHAVFFDALAMFHNLPYNKKRGWYMEMDLFIHPRPNRLWHCNLFFYCNTGARLWLCRIKLISSILLKHYCLSRIFSCIGVNIRIYIKRALYIIDALQKKIT